MNKTFHNKRAKSPKLTPIFDEVSEKIRQKILPAGAKLPSLRQFADEQGISKSSAVEVYERLVANGLVEARGQRGFFVKRSEKRHQDRQLNDAGLGLNATLRGRRHVLRFHPSGGWIDPKLLPSTALRAAIREVSRTRLNDLMDYNDCQGYLPLRILLADRLTNIGIEAPADDLIITDSASMGVDLICRVFLQPGDTILVDDPTSLDFLALQRTHRVTVLGIPFHDGQRNLSILKELVARHNPKLYILNTNLQNPTGSCISTQQAFELLSIAQSKELVLVEDDVYADLEVSSSVRLAALAGLENVIYLSSFSKTISPSIRCGYLCGSNEVIDRLSAAALDTTFGLNSLTSQIVQKLLLGGHYRRGMISLNKSVDEARQASIQILRDLGFEVPYEPFGGIFIWARWRGQATAKLIAEVALLHGMALATGPSFSPAGAFGQYIRFNCTLMQSSNLQKVLRLVLLEAEATRNS